MVLISVILMFIGLGIFQAIHLVRLAMLVEGDLWKLSSVASGHEMLAVCTKHFSIMKAMSCIK